MIDRNDILQELGLAPLWRLRRAQCRARALPAPLPAVHVARDAASDMRPSRPARRTIAWRASPRCEWHDFAADVAACTACELCKTRQRTVPGVGDVRAEWMFVGEAPGAEEDARGEPFVGQAGRLLDNMLAALGMRRDKNVYIANVLKCRPPGNRAPTPLEVAGVPALPRPPDRADPPEAASSRWAGALRRRCSNVDATHREPARPRAPLPRACR